MTPVAPDAFVRGCARKRAMMAFDSCPTVWIETTDNTHRYAPRGGPFDFAQGKLRPPYTNATVRFATAWLAD